VVYGGGMVPMFMEGYVFLFLQEPRSYDKKTFAGDRYDIWGCSYVNKHEITHSFQEKSLAAIPRQTMVESTRIPHSK
jgi:hypothetical protein